MLLPGFNHYLFIGIKRYATAFFFSSAFASFTVGVFLENSVFPFCAFAAHVAFSGRLGSGGPASSRVFAGCLVKHALVPNFAWLGQQS